MSYAYPSAPPFRPSRRNTTTESPNLLEKIKRALPLWAKELIAELRAPPGGRSRGDLKALGWRIFRRVVTVVNLVILFWVWTLWWGERAVFQESLEGCRWGNWEKWVSCPLLYMGMGLYLKANGLFVILLACECHAASSRFHCGSSISRPPYVPWAAVAAVYPDSQVYGPIPASVIFINAKKPGSRFGGVSGGLV